ncbi:MAG: rRNA maturation RNase YbeY [Erysipelotrichaceae bacterium]|nr:rRNA maturation RNase YbeY [Erysipelotrichaceae bacterium]MBQ1534092.1 rRNA maturation RNase YbeY [Erysipelotrichaceae bacterium]MBQ5804929.1 rRNA maturation RNase YbeY [Erysipelotrichaceae bacterium]
MLNIVNRTKYRDLEQYFPELEKYYRKTLNVLKMEDNYVLSLIICGPVTIRKINREYRNIDAVTDVISFALLDSEDAVEYEDRVELGDIFINRNRVLSQAEEYAHSVKREFVFLFVHGLLHLLGYDHMNEEEEKIMFDLQKKIVRDLK